MTSFPARRVTYLYIGSADLVRNSFKNTVNCRWLKTIVTFTDKSTFRLVYATADEAVAYMFYRYFLRNRLPVAGRCVYVLQLFFRPPGTAVPDGLMFYRRCFLFLFFATHSPRSLDRSP